MKDRRNGGPTPIGGDFGALAASCESAAIGDLGLNDEALEALDRAGIGTIGGILGMSRDDLAALEGMSPQLARETEAAVKAYVEGQAGQPTARRVDPDMRVGHDPETGYVLPPDHRSIEFDRALSNLFDVDERDFQEVPLEALGLKVRPMNCLASAGCETVDQLLDMTTRELASIRSMGDGSLRNIFSRLQQYIQTSPGARMHVTRIDLDENPAFRAAVEALLAGRDVDTEQLSHEMTALFSDYEKAVEAVGEEICLALYMDPKYGGQIVEVLTEFGVIWARWTQSIAEMRGLMEKVPVEILGMRALPFMRAFEAQNEPLSNVIRRCGPDTLVRDIVDVAERMKNAGEDPRDARRMTALAQWLNFDMPSLMREAISEVNSRSADGGARLMGMLTKRCEGAVLESIGAEYGITRERVRQLLNSAARKFWGTQVQMRHDIVLSAYALLDGPTFLTEDDLVAQLGPLGHFVWTCATGLPPGSRPYVHVPDIDVIAVLLGEFAEWDIDRVLQTVRRVEEELPHHVLDADLDKECAKAARRANAPASLGPLAAKASYQRTGNLWHKGKITRIFMYSYVLREFFQNGFRIGTDTDEFRRRIGEVFGEEEGNVATNHALDAKATEIGVLCARGTHIHPDYLQVDDDTMAAIQGYIEASPRSVILYSQIFEDLKDRFKGTQINSKYLLQGALKKYGCKYPTCRDFVRKSPRATLADEIESYIEQRGRISREELIEVFPNLSDGTLSQMMSRMPSVLHVKDGWYVHAREFDVRPEDYEDIREYLTEATKDGPISAGAALKGLRKRGSKILEHNDVGSRRTLFALLRHMFGSEFHFSRPYIAREGDSRVTNRSAIQHYLAGAETADLFDLAHACRERSINFMTIGALGRLLAPEYVRVSNDQVMRADVAGITQEVAEKTLAMIGEQARRVGYVSGSWAARNLELPPIGVPWNKLVVDSIVAGWGEDDDEIGTRRAPGEQTDLIFYAPKYEGSGYTGFISHVLRDKWPNKDATRAEALAWLEDQGLTGVPAKATVEEALSWLPAHT